VRARLSAAGFGKIFSVSRLLTPSMDVTDSFTFALSPNMWARLDVICDKDGLPKARVSVIGDRGSIEFDYNSWYEFYIHKEAIIAALTGRKQELCITIPDETYNFIIRTNSAAKGALYFYQQNVKDRFTTHLLLAETAAKTLFGLNDRIKRHFFAVLFKRNSHSFTCPTFFPLNRFN
jgi:hypothetical protein